MQHVDLLKAVEIGIAIAIALGAKDIAAAFLRALARKIRAHVKGTPSKADDRAGNVVANLVELAADAARRGDLDKVREFVLAAAALPATTTPATPRASR